MRPERRPVRVSSHSDSAHAAPPAALLRHGHKAERLGEAIRLTAQALEWCLPQLTARHPMETDPHNDVKSRCPGLHWRGLCFDACDWKAKLVYDGKMANRDRPTDALADGQQWRTITPYCPFAGIAVPRLRPSRRSSPVLLLLSAPAEPPRRKGPDAKRHAQGESMSLRQGCRECLWRAASQPPVLAQSEPHGLV